MKAEELDKKFDEGVEVLEYFNLDSAKRPGLETKRVSVDFPIWMVDALDSVDFPIWMVDALDKEALRLGVHRQAIIKTWIASILDAKVV